MISQFLTPGTADPFGNVYTRTKRRRFELLSGMEEDGSPTIGKGSDAGVG